MIEKMKKPILVTGCCGFVGRNIVKLLLKQRQTIWGVDNLIGGRHPREWLTDDFSKDKFKFFQLDCREFFKKNRKTKFGDVYHFAAVVGGRMTIDYEPLAVATDLSIDAEFFNWAIQAKPERILYPSSPAAYPIHLQNRKRLLKLKEKYISFEKKIGVPDMTYGWSKLTGEFLARFAAKQYGLHVTCVRPFSGYGGDQDLTYPIPAIAQRVVDREDPLTIWGTGKQVRDFIYIDDCLEGMQKALDVISNGSAVNLGSGKPMNFIQVAKIFTKIVGYQPKIKPLVDKPVGVKYRCADITYMKKKLGWEPKVSAKEGFTRVVDYLKEKK